MRTTPLMLQRRPLVTSPERMKVSRPARRNRRMNEMSSMIGIPGKPPSELRRIYDGWLDFNKPSPEKGKQIPPKKKSLQERT